MSRESLLIVFGLLITLSPWSGLPIGWLTYSYGALGIAVAVIGFTRKKRAAQQTPLEPTLPIQQPETNTFSAPPEPPTRHIAEVMKPLSQKPRFPRIGKF